MNPELLEGSELHNMVQYNLESRSAQVSVDKCMEMCVPGCKEHALINRANNVVNDCEDCAENILRQCEPSLHPLPSVSIFSPSRVVDPMTTKTEMTRTTTTTSRLIPPMPELTPIDSSLLIPTCTRQNHHASIMRKDSSSSNSASPCSPPLFPALIDSPTDRDLDEVIFHLLIYNVKITGSFSYRLHEIPAAAAAAAAASKGFCHSC